MGWVDQVPEAGNLYIGGLHALYQKPDIFQRAGITHILSVLDFDIYGAGAFKEYQHFHIRLDDDPNENLLQHFEEANGFIEKALSGGGGVFVHCAMGKSRSATIVCAWLMRTYGLSPLKALVQLCEGRPVCSPNPGFMEQLGIYSHMLKAENSAESDSIYKKWLGERYTGEAWTWDRRWRESKL